MKFNRKKIFAWLLAGFFLVSVSALLTVLTHPMTKRLVEEADRMEQPVGSSERAVTGSPAQ